VLSFSSDAATDRITHSTRTLIIIITIIIIIIMMMMMMMMIIIIIIIIIKHKYQGRKKTCDKK
jgi:hypothetical protein